MINDDDNELVVWCKIPNGEPGIVVWFWNELGQVVFDPAQAVGVVASDRFSKFHKFKIEETTFDEVTLQ